MSTHPSVGIDGVQPDIAILTSAFTDARTKRERDGIPVEEDLDDEKRSLDSNEKDLDEKRKVSIRVQPVDEEGVRWAGGDETLQAAGDDDDPEYANIPMIVRELCDFEDDPSTPIMTWRFYILSGIFTALGAWLTQMGFFRTTYIPYSIYFVQIASLYFGRLLAATLPKRIIGRGRFSFQLNPGPFSVKEHVAIVLAANTGATNNMGDYVLAPLDVFYNKPMNGWLAILFMWSAVFVGFAYASFARRFLIDDPQIIFPLTVQQWNYFFSYVAYIGAFVSLALFQGPMLWKSAKAQFRGERLHKDRLCNLMLAYPTVPWQWNVALFVIPVIILICLTATGILYMPIYALFVALAFGAAIVVPMAYIYAVSGYTTQVGYFNEIVYGYLINLGGSRHPIGSLSYRVISGQAWYEACAMLSDMKLAHYFHVPPRQTLLSQIWGIVIGVPVNYLTIKWVCDTKRDFLTRLKMDPQRQWTGQTVISLNNQGIQFALVGPKRLFADDAYTPLLYGFVLGAALPFLLYGLHRFFPRARFDLWSVTIFCTNMETFYGNISNNFFTKYLLGCVNFYIKRNKYEFWKKYAYLAGAAADTGYNLNMLFLFIAFSAVKTINMPHWWGNNADSVESCFPAST